MTGPPRLAGLGLDKLGITPIPHVPTNPKPPASPVAPAAKDSEPSGLVPTSGPIRFSQVRHRATAAAKKKDEWKRATIKQPN